MNKMKITTLKKAGHMFLFVTHVSSEILDLNKNFKTKTQLLQRCGTLYMWVNVYIFLLHTKLDLLMKICL